MNRAWLVSAAVIVAALVQRPRDAEACSCAYDGTTAPADGATEVPVNVAIIVRNSRSVPPDPGYVLRGPAGEVPLALEVVETSYAHKMYVLKPTSALAPGSDYVLEADNELTPDVRFTTGAAADTAAPSAPTVGALALATAELIETIGTSCGDRFEDLELALGMPPDAVALELTITVGGEARRHLLLTDDLPLYPGWNDGCNPQFRLVPGARHEIEVVARDLSGNRSEPVTRSASATECPVIPDPDCGELLERGLQACADGYDDCPVPIEPPPVEPPPDRGGCTSAPGASPAATLALLLLLLGAARVRRGGRQPTRSRTRPPAHHP